MAGNPGNAQRIDESLFGGLITPAAGDRFGSSVAYANAAGVLLHPCADLVIGVPGANSGRGAVLIAHGSSPA